MCGCGRVSGMLGGTCVLDTAPMCLRMLCEPGGGGVGEGVGEVCGGREAGIDEIFRIDREGKGGSPPPVQTELLAHGVGGVCKKRESA
jgi:hypothetical protein